MTKFWITALVGVLAVGGSSSVAEEFKRTEHPEAQWFGNAGLGLFVHWGISSVHGNCELSWAMMARVPWGQRPQSAVTPEEYFKLAEKFSPGNYDPDRWLRAAKTMGCTYAVLTTKHHDGFALWPSSYSDYGTRSYLQGRDLVKPFVEACRKNGLKVGLYYSPPDWYYNRDYMSFNYPSHSGKDPSAPWTNVRQEVVTPPKKPAGWDAGYKAYVKRQVEELLTEYGKVDLLWFDGGPDAISIDRIRELQPGIVINKRMHRRGDFDTPEWDMPTEPPKADWWENCTSWLSGWGYRSNEQYHSAAWMLTRLIQVRAWGGNLLLNVGPRPDGDLPEVAYARMREVAAWMKHSGESVFGTSAGPWPSPCNVPVTVKGKVWYLHVLPDFKDAVVVTGVQKPVRVSLLRMDRYILHKFADGRLEIKIPDFARTDLPDVVKVIWP